MQFGCLQQVSMQLSKFEFVGLPPPPADWTRDVRETFNRNMSGHYRGQETAVSLVPISSCLQTSVTSFTDRRKMLNWKGNIICPCELVKLLMKAKLGQGGKEGGMEGRRERGINAQKLEHSIDSLSKSGSITSDDLSWYWFQWRCSQHWGADCMLHRPYAPLLIAQSLSSEAKKINMFASCGKMCERDISWWWIGYPVWLPN